MEQLPVGPGPDLVNHGGLQVHKHGPGHVLPRPGLGEEGVEGVIASPDGLVAGHLAIGLDAVLEAVELPAGVTDLSSGLADMNGDTFSLNSDNDKYEESMRTVMFSYHGGFVVFEGFCCGTTSQDSVQPSNVVITQRMLRSHRSVASTPYAGPGERGAFGGRKGGGGTLSTPLYYIPPLSKQAWTRDRSNNCMLCFVSCVENPDIQRSNQNNYLSNK